MNIIMINGSPRENGATAKFLHAMEKELLKKADVSVEFINISKLKMNPCSGCCSCYKSGHCYMNDDAEALSDKIEKADGLIIGSPTYASNISGQLKQFVDRGHFVIEQLLYNKYAVSIATGENYGNKDTSKVLNKLLQYSGAKLSGKIIYKLPFNANPDNDKNLNKKVQTLAEKIYKDIKKQKKYLIQEMVHRVIFSVGIKPFVMSKGELYQGVVARWKNYGIMNGND